MAQYTQRTQPMHRYNTNNAQKNDPKSRMRPGQTDHGVGGGALAYGGGGKGGQQRPPAAPYPAQPYPPLRLHQPGYGSAALTFRDGSYRGGGGAVGEYRAGVGVGVGTRMSLLGAAYLPPPAPPALHPPPADPPPYKKIRITQDRPSHPQLRVDTREPVNTYNTVEVLSPNPPSEPTVEDQSFRTTKDELLQQISKVDREMALSEATLSKLRKKQEELMQTASRPARAEEPEEAVPRHRSLAQCVYAENRKQAAAAHALLSHLGPPIVYPLYNQPQDTEVYHENIRRHRGFRKRLADHIHRLKLESEKLGSSIVYPLYNQPQDTEVYHENIRRHRGFRKRLADHIHRLKLESEKREDALAEAYSRRAAEWMRRVERIEQGQKRKAKDARNRELFEKVFPELRKQREERERFNRLGARVKSEAELEEIADGLHEQEHEDKKMRSLTVVPPLLRHRGDTTPIYIDTNRRCMDMEAEHKELQFRNVWSRTERDIFREKYLQHPKNFGQVASFLPRKSVRDCVRFYYLSKKAENYKQVLRKPRARRVARGPRPAPEPELPAGVTTRLQRSMGTTPRGENKDGSSMEEGGGTPESGPPATPAAPLNTPTRPELIRTPPLPPSPPPASSAPPAPVTATSESSVVGTPPPASEVPSCGSPADIGITTTPPAITTVTTSCATGCTATPLPLPPAPAPPTPVPAASPGAACISAPHTPQPDTAVTERTITPTPTNLPTTTISIASPSSINANSSPCAVCNAPGATRTVSRSRAAHYGLREEAAGARVCEPCHCRSRAAHYGLREEAAGARVCEPCHCRCVRSRYTRCPVPTCPGPRVRAKRLRHLPPRWHDLPVDVKRPLMDEFQIPSELSKCCLACFKRITRRLETVGEGGSNPEPTEEEASRFRTLIKEHGTAWDRMSAASGRTPASLKAFYFTYRKRFQLDALVAEKPAPKGSDTDDSILSSGDTDTASAESPRPPPLPGPRTDAVAPKGRRRDEYDSSATETADEENDAPSAKIIPTITLSTPVSSDHSTPPLPASTPITTTTNTISTLNTSTLPGNPGITSTTSVTSAASVARNGPAGAQLSVRDVVLNMIEISLLKNSQPVPPHHKAPPPKVSTPAAPRETLATLSVVSSSHVSSSPASPHRPATITPLQNTPSQAQPQQDVKEGVVVVIEPRQEPLLDLSVKRPRRDLPPANTASVQAKPPYRNSTDYQYRPERESPNQYNSKPKPLPQITPPRPTLKPVPNPKGSITLGTPVENRFEARRTPPDPKTGSITAGTPVHHLPEKKFDYYSSKRKSPGGPAYYTGVTSQPRPHSPSFSPNAGYPRPYLDNRQIIMTDFITSQQMHGGARRERPERVPSPHHQQHQQHQHQHHQHQPQRRENVSVIQRHSYGHTVPHTPSSGHEAFKSLVEAAASATALPVPREAKPEPKHPPHHDIRGMSDRMQSHMAIAQKYHQHQQQMQQYQVLERERDRRAQVQYIERDRQMQQQMQQNRDRERAAMAALQERQIAMEQHQQQQHQQHQQQQAQQQHIQQQQQQHQQQQAQQQHQQQQAQLMHERHMQHQQIVSSQEERRMLSGVTYSTAAPKHRAITPLHVDRKDNRGPPVSCAPAPPQVSTSVVSSVGVPPTPQQPPPVPAGAAERPRPTEGTLTAASLIDAIITHQISQTSDQRYPGLIREESNPPPPQEREPQRPPTAAERERDREQREREREDAAAAAAAHTTSMKLGDLASNIITRDFCSPTTSMLHHNSRFAVSEGYAAGGQHKHAPYLEPVSPPDNHPNNRNNSTRRGGSVLTAFDYVTNRIVEVMRSDADERKPLAFPTGGYAYPYSALTVTGTIADGAAPANAAPAPAPAPAPEPAPIMSAQYEPLSDED